MTSYDLKPGLLSYCQGKWNSETKSFEEDNSMDTIECCLENCKERIQYCFDTCHGTFGPDGKNPSYKNHKECHKKCSELVKNCESVCLEYPSEGIQLISKCTNEKGCGEYPTFNRKCMENNKKDIIECCYKSCIPSSTVDCQKQCNDFYDHLATGTNSPLTKIESEYELSRSNFRKSKKDNYIFIYILIILIIIFGLYILFF